MPSPTTPSPRPRRRPALRLNCSWSKIVLDRDSDMNYDRTDSRLAGQLAIVFGVG